MESVTLTLGGLIYIFVLNQKSAEAILGRKRAIPRSKGQRWKSHRQTEGLNVRMANKLNSIIDAATEAETRKRTTYMRIGQQPKVEYKRSLSAQ